MSGAALSADGRYVAFTSPTHGSSDLLPGQAFFGTTSVFVRDRQTGALQVADLTTDGEAVGGFRPVLTPDGRYVAFLSTSAALIPAGVTQGHPEDGQNAGLFLRNLATGVTTLVSINPAHDRSNDVTVGAEVAVSDDGNLVAYTSHIRGAVAGVSDPGAYSAVYLYDVRAGTTTLVSHDPADDGQVRGISDSIRISGDGRYVSFLSRDPGLTGQASDSVQVFRWDRTTGRVALVSAKGHRLARAPD
ncbi:MAG: hypothetical protein LC708_01260, partial [Actinobacteria bacterium]|nr:hypothetical protein [Actinomycetota bacterium]